MPKRLVLLVLMLFAGLAPVAGDTVGDYAKIMEGIAYEARVSDTMMWVIDQSPSMADDIAEIHSRIEDMMGVFRKQGRKVPVGIVTYADRPSLHLAPTEDVKELKDAFGRIKIHGAGKESLYGAIELAAEKGKKGKYPYIVVATDEAGDDLVKIEAVCKLLEKKNMRVLILTPNATFGNRDWGWSETSMKASTTTFFDTQNGPESLDPEALFDFHFVQRSDWSSTINLKEYRVWAIKSGWAPFGLQLLADKTGGKIFELTTDTCRLNNDFTEENMPQYAPDVDYPSLVKRNVNRNSWRKAVDDAVQYWGRGFKPIEREWPGQTKSDLINGVNRQFRVVLINIKTAERVLEMLRLALEQPLKIRGYSMDEVEVQSLRWRANLELAYASALIARYHSHQFLLDVERFKKDDFWPDPQNDVCQWNIKIVRDGKSYDTEELKESGYRISGGPAKGLLDMVAIVPAELPTDISTMRIHAERALKVVAHNHPETPWCVMAEKLLRELGHYDVFINHCGPWSTGSAAQ